MLPRMRRIGLGGAETGAVGAGRERRSWWRRKRVLIPVGLLALIVVISVLNPQPQQAAAPGQQASTQQAEATQDPAPEQPAAPAVPAEHRAALEKAQMYSDTMRMSKAGVHDQLTSAAGEGFPKAAADYAVANVKADWKANALEKAKQYRETMNMSNAAIREQLVSQAGEKFTKTEAEWAVEHLDK